jgi:hypothetical protein
MFISAMDDFPFWRAQYMVEKYSGNSDRNGATHWMKGTAITPAHRPVQHGVQERSAEKNRISLPPMNSARW